MKGIVLIFSLFLSCTFCGTGAIHAISEGILHETVISSTDKNTSEKKADFNDLAILPVGRLRIPATATVSPRHSVRPVPAGAYSLLQNPPSGSSRPAKSSTETISMHSGLSFSSSSPGYARTVDTFIRFANF